MSILTPDKLCPDRIAKRGGRSHPQHLLAFLFLSLFLSFLALNDDTPYCGKLFPSERHDFFFCFAHGHADASMSRISFSFPEMVGDLEEVGLGCGNWEKL